jgi:hypothetical protein
MKLFKPTKDSAPLVEKIIEKSEKPPLTQESAHPKVKELSNNIYHLANLFTLIFKRAEPKEVISGIKNYVLEEESDLGDIELGII